jgi:release factor glutamine methyltransferase
MTEPNAPWTVLRLLDWTKDYFARAGVESPRLCAEVLLAHVIGCRRIELYARFNYEPASDELATYRQLVKRAVEHEPVAYLVGTKEFYSLNFRVTHDVLIPRPETEILVSEAANHLRALEGTSITAWDVCTGSGCVAAAIAHNVANARVLATDISPAAVEVAAGNVESLGLAQRVLVAQADLLELPDEAAELAPFDVITANPPYVAEGDELGQGVEHEPREALFAGRDGLEVIRRIVADAPARLRSGGMLAMEFGQGQADAVRDLLVTFGDFDEPRIVRDLQGIERAAVALRR